MIKKFVGNAQLLWLDLDLAQRWYLSATVCLLIWLALFGESNFFIWLFALCLFSATLVDLWQGFRRLWDSLAGKAVVLAFYAILGNFCYALADNQVNNIIGVRSDVVPFSINLTLLLLIPVWSFILSFLVLSIYTVLHTAKATLLLLLRPLGLRSHHLFGQQKYAIITLLARIIYIPIILVFSGSLLTSYLTGNSSEINILGQELAIVPNSTDSAAQPQDLASIDNLAATAKTGSEAAPTTAPFRIKQGNKDIGLTFNGLVPDVLWMNKLIAGFLYHIESLNKSSCKMQGQEHLVHLNDFEVLVITPNEKTDLGYDYKVRLCGSVGFQKAALLGQ